MKTNALAVSTARTHEGAPAIPAEKPIQELRRAVLSCLLFEDTFYESGSMLAERIRKAAVKCSPEEVSRLAIAARRDYGLRHVSLFLALQLINRGLPNTAETISQVIQRPDELSEIIALYWKMERERKRLPHSLKRGIAKAFVKFSAHRLAKYDRDSVVKLRDAMFLTHPKPVNDEQVETFKLLASRSLVSPDTWEVALSSGADKKATWERLLAEKNLGALALIRNLRGMDEAGVDRPTIKSALAVCDTKGIQPWQIIGAAVHAPWAEPELEAMMFRAVKERSLAGQTSLLIDVSGSMEDLLSAKGERTRLDAACALAMVAREVCAGGRIFTFSDHLAELAPRRGFALADAIHGSQPHSGTYLGAALKAMTHERDRLIVITDEQSHDSLPTLSGKVYMVNVGPYKPTLQSTGNFHRISGWSDRLLDWIVAHESEN